MALENALLLAEVMHARARPKRNRFLYRVYYLSIGLSQISHLAALRLLKIDKTGVFSLHQCDYTSTGTLESWIRSLLEEWHVPQADGEVTLVTMPRLFGYAFNPVTFWFCHDKNQRLRAVFADVTNTFGERHGYMLFHEDRRPIAPEDWLESPKVFHVSPFIDVTGHYKFKFEIDDASLHVVIQHHDEEGMLLATSMHGTRVPLTSRQLLICCLRYPLVTLKVIGLIHFQALKLFLKGVRYRVKPNPPKLRVTR